MYRKWMAAALILVGAAAFGESALPNERDFERLHAEFQAALDRLRETHGFPGATAAFALSDGRLGAAATGLADTDVETPMQPNDRMFSGSIGKTFVAAVALSLAGAGKLDLDAPISTWLGDEPWFADLVNGDRMTARHLLNHSSGVRNHLDEAAFGFAAGQRISAERLDEPFSPEELVRFVLRKEPHFEPGHGFHYTDTGYILLGLVIERAAGAPYYDLLQQRFLGPLRLTLTSPAIDRRIPGLIPGYLSPDNRLGLPECSMSEQGLLVIHPGSEWTGGGLVTNSQDLARWGMALYHDRILGDDLTLRMLSETIPVHNENGMDHYGLGVFIIDTPLGITYGHGGWYPGYNSQLVYFPAREFAVAIQVNRDFDNPRMDYIAALAEPVFRAFAMSEAP